MFRFPQVIGLFYLFLSAWTPSTSLAFDIRGITELQAVSGSGDCSSHSLQMVMNDVDFSNNDDGSNKDHFSYALVDGNGLVLDFQDASLFNIDSPDTILVALPLTGITARPVRMVVYEKHSSSSTPGLDDQQRFAFAESNSLRVVDRSTDLVELGLSDCASVLYSTCPDPMVFLDGLEDGNCGDDTNPLEVFEVPLGTNEICIPSGSSDTGIGTINYCQNSCGSGTGCALTYTTSDRTNISEDKFCGAYQVQVPAMDIDSAIADCTIAIDGKFHLQADWQGTYTAPRTWGYTVHSLQVQGLETAIVDEDCVIVPKAILDLLLEVASAQVQAQIETVFDGHFSDSAGAKFCPVNSLHPEFIP